MIYKQSHQLCQVDYIGKERKQESWSFALFKHGFHSFTTNFSIVRKPLKGKATKEKKNQGYTRKVGSSLKYEISED